MCESDGQPTVHMGMGGQSNIVLEEWEGPAEGACRERWAGSLANQELVSSSDLAFSTKEMGPAYFARNLGLVDSAIEE